KMVQRNWYFSDKSSLGCYTTGTFRTRLQMVHSTEYEYSPKRFGTGFFARCLVRVWHDEPNPTGGDFCLSTTDSAVSQAREKAKQEAVEEAREEGD
ncbi:MAG: hypothetical protein K8R36_06270, partial [Planctomycetales bacterium]|nr:hypothetical protein [Planctomycetales bacterium]